MTSGTDARAVIEVLLRGPTAEERARGLEDPFGPSMSQGKNTGRLGDYLHGVRVEGRHAVLDFAPGGMDWLNNTACVQEAVKTAIERTLGEAFGIERVDYAIDGRIVAEWDA